MKVLMYMYSLVPYKVDFCNILGKYVDLTVVFEKGFTSDRNSDWQKSIQMKNFKAYFLSDDSKLQNIFNPTLIKIIKNNKFDIIDFGVYADLKSMRAIKYMHRHKIPFIFGIDGGIISKNEHKLKYKLKKSIISKAHYYISPGEVSDKYLIYYGAKKDKIFHYHFTSLKSKDILNELITTKEKEKIRKNLNILEKNMVISIGQFVYRKGYDVLLKSANIIDKNTGIYIIGGKPTDEYINLKNELKLDNVHFVDFLQKKELKEYYKAADLFVFPTREDIWGLVINEAMSYGLPIVTTDNCVAGLELVHNGENGYIVEVEDGSTLCEKTNMIINDKKLKNKMSKNSLEKIKNYTIENMAKEHYKIFKEINNK